MTRVNSQIPEELPEFIERLFTCPLCGRQTTVVAPMDYIVAKRVECNQCGRVFVIRDDGPRGYHNEIRG